MKHTAEPLEFPHEPFAIGGDSVETTIGRTLVEVTREEQILSLAALNNDFGGGYGAFALTLSDLAHTLPSVAPYYETDTPLITHLRLPTMSGLYDIKRHYLDGHSAIANVNLQLVDGGELSAKAYLESVLSGSYPIATAPEDHIHDLGNHALGALTLPADSFGAFQVLVADAHEFEANGAADQATAEASNLYYGVLGRALDTVTDKVLTSAPAELSRLKLGLVHNVVAHIKTSGIVAGLEGAQLARAQAAVENRIEQVIAANLVTDTDGDSVDILEWEDRNLEQHYLRIRVLLGNEAADKMLRQQHVATGLSRIFSKIRKNSK